MKYRIRAIYKNGFIQETSLLFDSKEEAEKMADKIRKESSVVLGESGRVEIVEE